MDYRRCRSSLGRGSSTTSCRRWSASTRAWTGSRSKRTCAGASRRGSGSRTSTSATRSSSSCSAARTRGTRRCPRECCDWKQLFECTFFVIFVHVRSYRQVRSVQAKCHIKMLMGPSTVDLKIHIFSIYWVSTRLVPQACGKLSDFWPTENIWSDRKASLIKKLPLTKRWRHGVRHSGRGALETEYGTQPSE